MSTRELLKDFADWYQYNADDIFDITDNTDDIIDQYLEENG